MPDDTKRIPIGQAIAEYKTYIIDGGARQSTLSKYQTLMDQLEAYCEWRRFQFVDELGQDAVLEFRREWENEKAGYKMRKSLKDRPRWRKMSIATCRRSGTTTH